MPERDQLLAILRRVRRRLRSLAALQGAVAGAAAALAAGAPWFLVERWHGGPQSLTALTQVLVVLGAALLAAVACAGRRVPLQRCAQKLDRGGAGDDRTLSALAFLHQPATPFSRAAIRDAVDRASGIPAAQVAPLRRPHGTVALAAAAIALVAAAFAPLPRQHGRALATAVAAPRPHALLDSRDVDAEKEELRAAVSAAQALSDQTLGALAKELNAAVSALLTSGTERGDALDRLAALQRRAEEAARDAEALANGLRRTGQALQSTPATRALSEGLTSGDAAATEQAATDLAAHAESVGPAQRGALAKAFERAANQASGRGGAAVGSNAAESNGDSPAASAANEERQRRLQRETPAENQSADSDPPDGRAAERQLQHLERDLRDTARACQDSSAACQQHLRSDGRGLSRMQQQSRGAGARRRLAEAIQQLRERLRRGDQSQRGDSAQQRRQQGEQRRFARAAAGQDSSLGAGATGRDQSERGSGADRDGDDDDQEGGDEPSDNLGSPAPGAGEQAGQSAAGEAAAGAADTGAQGGAKTSADGTASNGEGIGNQTGGDALGRQKDLQATHGREREASVRSAAGPRRSQVIEAAAAHGFAHSDYRRVYQDYGAVVEESLDVTTVPPGQRYLVRRYFQLIRPRTKSTAPRSAPSGDP